MFARDTLYVCEAECNGSCIELRGLLVGADSFLPACLSWVLNSDCYSLGHVTGPKILFNGNYMRNVTSIMSYRNVNVYAIK